LFNRFSLIKSDEAVSVETMKLTDRFNLIKRDEAVSVFENKNTSVYGVKEVVESLNGCKLRELIK